MKEKLKKDLTRIKKIFIVKQASKQASKQARRGADWLFNLLSKELRGGCRLATEVAL